jgi:Arc/MetJ-type ribon-helix-helix transcriptional regulator
MYMDIQLAPEQIITIRELVDDGQFPNSEAVIAEALRLLVQNMQKIALQAKLQVGLDQLERGEFVEFTPEFSAAAMSRAVQRAANGETPDPDVCPR